MSSSWSPPDVLSQYPYNSSAEDFYRWDKYSRYNSERRASGLNVRRLWVIIGLVLVFVEVAQQVVNHTDIHRFKYVVSSCE